ncbi:hypothetical protein ACH5RR_015886 [Cinchona calisaya]|uniref:Uncharacterized protein n=1 Tax=Cinchona calisaya TaxID=153742 RepID=A0ABD2ZY17_9GENT
MHCSRSSTEAKYHSLATTTAELHWISSLLTDLGTCIPASLVIYCDNVGATHLCSNPIFHSQMKHVGIDYHFILYQVQNGALRITHVSSEDELVDVLTMPLPRTRFQLLKTKIRLSIGALS